MSQGTYSLRSGPAEREADRLKQGHGVLFETTGNLLPPSIKIDYSQPLSIADVGTGTGDWLFQMEQLVHPGSTLRGIDITNTQFQNTAESSSVFFHIQNMLLPFPDAELAHYDVVHARLLYAGRLSLLGGTSYGLFNCVPATIAWTEFIMIDQRASLATGRDLLFVNKLGRYFREAGLLDITGSIHSTFDSEDEGREKVTALMLRLHEQSAKGAVARGGVDGLRTMEDVDKLVNAMKTEV